LAASLANHGARPHALGEHLSVILIPTVAGDLRRLQRRTRLSTTDLMNRAITSYEFLEAQLRAGRDLIVRDNGTGETRLVRFLDAPVGQARRGRPRLPRRGRRPLPDATWPTAYSPAAMVGTGWPTNHGQDRLPLTGLAGQEVSAS
jgi:hypothetical protein